METTLRSPFPSSSAASSKPEGTLNMASSSAHAAVDSIAGKAKPAIDGVAGLAHQAVDKVADAAAPAADWLTEQGESLKNAQKKLVHDTSGYISTHPLTSVAIAVAAGFVISRVIR